MIRFQDDLIERVNSYKTVSDFPQTILLCEERGAGKHTISKYIADKFHCDIKEIESEMAVDISVEPPVSPTFFVLNITEMTVKEQNSVLKFLEEPPANTYIICICESKRGVLETILNRCVEFEMEPYFAEQLETFTDNHWLPRICRTPGQVIEMEKVDFREINDFVNNFFDKISIANFANALKVTDKIAFKAGEAGYDFEFVRLFIRFVAYRRYFDSVDDEDKLKVTTDFLKESMSAGVDKRMLFDNYLCRMKGLAK